MTDFSYTMVLTSCKRHDLLKETLDSFCQYVDIKPASTIIIEDSNIIRPYWLIENHYSNLGNLIWIQNEGKLGQVPSLDKAYSLVTTPYIFGCEDDWQFYKTGFIEKSLEILEKYPKILQVWLREHNDTNGHPIVKLPEFDFETMAIWGDWGGFSWNPGLRRLSDYEKIGSSYSKFGTEVSISKEYSNLGFKAAILPEGYVKHIGWGRSMLSGR